MSNEEGGKKYDLEERTAKFGEEIVAFARLLQRNDVTKRLIPQLVGSGTAIGANYCEADCAESNKDFIHKMAIANKEAKEVKFFLRMIIKACPQQAIKGRELWKEAQELNLIFTTIIRKAKETERKKEIV